MSVLSARNQILLVSAILIGCLASAQVPRPTPAYEKVLDGSKDPAAISLTEATMAFYRNVIAQDRRAKGGGVALLSSTLKFDEVTSRAYLNYMYMAVDDVQYQTVERLRLVCSRRNELKTPAQLADALEKLHLSVVSNWESSVTRSEGVLGAADKLVADTYILGTRKGIKLSVTDYGQYVAMSGKSVSEMIVDSCGSPDSRRQQ